MAGGGLVFRAVASSGSVDSALVGTGEEFGSEVAGEVASSKGGLAEMGLVACRAGDDGRGL